MDKQAQIEFILDHYENPRRRGALPGAEAIAEGRNPGCGDVVTIYLKVDPETGRAEVTFEGAGCTISQAAASYLAEAVTGQKVEDILAIDQHDLVDTLGRDIVEQRAGCVTLPLDTLRDAIHIRSNDFSRS